MKDKGNIVLKSNIKTFFLNLMMKTSFKNKKYIQLF